MQQIAIRLPGELLDEIDGILAAKRDGGRTAVIRELLWEAIDKRGKRK